jgi:type IV pilus assembly protein PilV
VQKGFSLIEVLVAVLVLAVGVLGIAGAQLAALQTRHGSGLMSSGTQLAGSLAERMRANRPQLASYLQLDYDALRSGPPSAPDALCFAGTTCDSAQMAALDLYDIRAAVHAGFPGGRIKVCRDASQGARLAWACTGGAGAPVLVKLGWRTRSDQDDDSTTFVPALAIVAGGGAP